MLSERGDIRAFLALTLAALIAVSPAAARAQNFQGGDQIVQAASRRVPWQRQAFLRGFAQGITGQTAAGALPGATSAAGSGKKGGSPFAGGAANGKSVGNPAGVPGGLSPYERAGIRLGDSVREGRTTLSPYARGWLTGGLQDMVNQADPTSGTPLGGDGRNPLGHTTSTSNTTHDGPLGHTTSTGDGPLAHGGIDGPPVDALANRGSLESPIQDADADGNTVGNPARPTDSFPGIPNTQTPTTPDGQTPGNPTGEPGGGTPPVLNPAPTTGDTNPDPDTGHNGNDPNADPNAETGNNPAPIPNSQTPNAPGKKDDGNSNMLPILLAGLGALGALALLANSGKDKNGTGDPAFNQGYQDGIQSPQGQDSWRPQAGPESNPGNYTPGTHGGYANYEAMEAAARRAAAQRQARARCVQGLTQMLDGMDDLAAGLAAQSAEAGALVGATGNVGGAEALLARAKAKLTCGAALTGTPTYNLPGYDAAVCESLSRDPSPTPHLPNVIAEEQLPGRWQQFLNELGESYRLMKSVFKVLRCRVSGGSCSLDYERQMNDMIRTNLARLTPGVPPVPGTPGAPSVADVCGGNPAALVNGVGRPYGLGPAFVLPLETCKTSSYGPRNYPRRGVHHGTDLRGNYGTPFQPVAPGTVIFTGRKGGYGNAIVIEHDDGSQSLYGHIMDGGILVQPGQHVGAYDNIGRIGSTGFSTGPHLHVEIRQRDAGGRLYEMDPEEALGDIPWC